MYLLNVLWGFLKSSMDWLIGFQNLPNLIYKLLIYNK